MTAGKKKIQIELHASSTLCQSQTSSDLASGTTLSSKLNQAANPFLAKELLSTMVFTPQYQDCISSDHEDTSGEDQGPFDCRTIDC